MATDGVTTFAVRIAGCCRALVDPTQGRVPDAGVFVFYRRRRALLGSFAFHPKGAGWGFQPSFPSGEPSFNP